MRPDGKSQVTVEYDEHNRPVRVDTVVISTQHDPDVSLEQIRKDMIEQVAKAVIPADMLDESTKYYVNPTGRFVKGGPAADSGLTGRKIIVDTYGGSAPHGGGCFSGKDPTKVDRSAAYMARYIAKNLVAAGLCRKCQIELAYAIGVAHPVSVLVDTYGTGVLDEEKLSAIVNECFDMRPAKIIEHLNLRRPIYEQTAPMATSVAPTWICPGSTPTWWRSSRAICKRRPSLCIICTPAAGSACGGRFLCNSRAAWRRAAASFMARLCA